MTDYEADFLQAFIDMQITVRQMVNDLDTSREGRLKPLAALSFIDGMVKRKIARYGSGDEMGCAIENRRQHDA